MTKEATKVEKMVDQMLAKNTSLSGEQRDKHKKTLINFFEKGKPAYKTMGFGKEMLEAIYGHAYRLYNTGKYDDALDAFQFLLMLNFLDARYSLGMGACFHQLKKWQDAINLYKLSAATDKTEPLPYYYAAECYKELDDPAAAFTMLMWVEERCKQHDVHPELLNKIPLLQEKFANQIGEKNKGKKMKFTKVEDKEYTFTLP